MLNLDEDACVRLFFKKNKKKQKTCPVKTVLLSIKGTDVKNALSVGVHMDNIRSQHTL